MHSYLNLKILNVFQFYISILHPLKFEIYVTLNGKILSKFCPNFWALVLNFHVYYIFQYLKF